MEEYILIENMFESSTSSSSSESDDNNDALQNILNYNRDERREVPKIRNYLEYVVARYTNVEFKSHFRMERNTFQFLLHLIGPNLDNPPFYGRKQIDATKQLLIGIYVLATSDSYRSISERFGVARSTAWYSVKRVVRAIYRIRNEFIRWPTHGEAATWTNLQRLYGFPKVLGIIDGTHINIVRPKQDANSYINRKGRFSVQLQNARMCP
ncbi:protein ANTAGONIST OF LIKE HETEROCHROMATIN PROTEIN 1-like isoform X2 [Ooceraea biroi]|uniref:protein ANTAGONIST OF LIKE HETEROCHROMATIN PROTEIN 1-like isoform X2 n=1 Tax=Ooceraea biroi TaxID=2015173 RepID=UPI0005BE33B6|nr:protein ANTAGONIST OF LIKE HETEROCHROMATIN PROTEIN 1-like isoform X2 [Ooceraea biroi]